MSDVQLLATPWTIARWAPLSMGICQARVPPRAPQLEETPETPPSSGAEGLLFLHGLESNPGSSLHCRLAVLWPCLAVVSAFVLAIAQSPGREAALAWASLAQRFPASSVLAREGAGCASVGDVPGAWLASAPLSPSLWT